LTPVGNRRKRTRPATDSDTMTRTYENRDVAKRYDSARALPEQTTQQWMAELKALLPLGRVETVLDLGCGTGRFTAALQSTLDCLVIGVDPSAEMLDQARARGLPGIEWRQGPAERIPLVDGAADLVWMSQVYHHLEGPESVFRVPRR